MKQYHSLSFLLTCFVPAMSCSSEPDEIPLETAASLPEYEMFVTDSFGVETGDSINMIGSIDGFCHAADGSLVLLDRTAVKVRIVSETGEAVCWGTPGEGPGEFLLPMGICAMTDGRILVSDTYRREVMEFNTSGDYAGTYISEDEQSIPVELFQVDSNSVVGSKLDIEFGENQILYSYYVGRFDSNCNPSLKYEEFVSDFSSPEIYNVIECMDFTADPAGRVFIAPDNTEYVIKVLTADGEPEHIIQQSIAGIPKTEGEIQAEIDEYEQLAAANPSYAPGYEPVPFHPLIAIAGVDHEGNLWVRQYNQESAVHFDVFSPGGDLVYTVSMEDPMCNEEIEFRIDSYGILGAVVDSDEYPRIYRYELNH